VIFGEHGLRLNAPGIEEYYLRLPVKVSYPPMTSRT